MEVARQLALDPRGLHLQAVTAVDGIGFVQRRIERLANRHAVLNRDGLIFLVNNNAQIQLGALF